MPREANEFCSALSTLMFGCTSNANIGTSCLATLTTNACFLFYFRGLMSVPLVQQLGQRRAQVLDADRLRQQMVHTHLQRDGRVVDISVPGADHHDGTRL